jgi:dihydrofolate synthase/folylpolyglutamate synthase
LFPATKIRRKNIIQQKANELNAKFIDATNLNPELDSDLKGTYQKKNIRVVLA